ncbi:hypothetical protein EGW08_010725 [Elysia chlorotica]|uniref:non-specific serine/threonine protein kinase n=1 Tax=Elysia chlorotica TaxID=188477 RepID=A0A3S1HKR7_ELYCH|nr:hypothetical protein EGW08_010725 [Elysia chlorotica]
MAPHPLNLKRKSGNANEEAGNQTISSPIQTAHAPVRRDINEPLLTVNEFGPAQYYGLRFVRELSCENSYVSLCERDQHPNEQVVVKIIPKDVEGETHSFNKRYASEISALKKVSHKHIIKMLDCHSFDTYNAILLEFCPYGTLFDNIMSNRIRRLGVMSTIFLHLSLAVLYLHEKRILHRDIKPSNILFGEDGRAILSDFDRAKFLSKSEHLVTGQAGTRIYYAPEVLKYSHIPYDGFKADIYACGLVLFMMVNRQRLHSGDDVWNRLDNLPWVRRCPVSGYLEEIMQHVLHPNPAKRWGIRDITSYLKERQGAFQDVVDAKM